MGRQRRLDLLNAYPQLNTITDPAWLRVLESAQMVQLRPGRAVFRTGEACQHYLFVIEGSIRVQRISEDGHEITLYHVRPGETCELTTSCLLAERSYPAEAITETEVRALLIPKAQFQQALATTPQFRSFVFASIDKRLTNMVSLVEEIAFGPVDRRLAQCLLNMADPHGIIHATHQSLATELGTAREVVSRQLKDFEKRGWVALHRGRVTLTNMEALQGV